MRQINHSVSHARVGYCSNDRHRGYVTVKSLKEHKCVEKECKFFKKFEDSLYWTERETIRVKKKLAKYYKQNEALVRSCNLNTFILRCKNFYGSYMKIPRNREFNLDISDFIVYMGLIDEYFKNTKFLEMERHVFIDKCKSYYGSYNDIPLSDNGEVQIEDFISYLKSIGLFIEEC